MLLIQSDMDNQCQGSIFIANINLCLCMLSVTCSIRRVIVVDFISALTETQSTQLTESCSHSAGVNRELQWDFAGEEMGVAVQRGHKNHFEISYYILHCEIQ